MALEVPELSPRELATRFTDTNGHFVSEASTYRLLKAHDLITSPAFIVIKPADEFKDKSTAPNQLWQTDFTYLKVIGWGWFYLSTILDDFRRYIIAWKLCTTMRADDVTDTLRLASWHLGVLQRVAHKPRLLSDNGSSYVSGDLAKWLEDDGMGHLRGPQTQGQDKVVNPRQELHARGRSSGGARSWRKASPTIDTADQQELSEALAAKTAHLKEKLVELEEEMDKLAGCEKQMLATPNQQILLTDPNS
jgi:transposase InsO family protein